MFTRVNTIKVPTENMTVIYLVISDSGFGLKAPGIKKKGKKTVKKTPIAWDWSLVGSGIGELTRIVGRI